MDMALRLGLGTVVRVRLELYTVSGKKGATLFFAITLPNPNRSSKFFYRHTQQ